MLLRKYETVCIVDPTAGQEGLEKVLGRMRDAISQTGGREVRLEDWGRRKLAYKLGKHARGHYLYLVYLGQPGTVGELERLLRITEVAIKYQTIELGRRIDTTTFDFEAALGEHTQHARPSFLEGTTLGAPSDEYLAALEAGVDLDDEADEGDDLDDDGVRGGGDDGEGGEDDVAADNDN